MLTNVWDKYLPIIRIVLKKSIASEQVLALNTADFERAGLKRKSGYKFAFRLKNGKPANVLVDEPLASSLVTVLTSDAAARQILDEREFELSLSPKFKLSITYIPQEKPVEGA